MSTSYTLEQPGCSPSIESMFPQLIAVTDGPGEDASFRGKLDEIGFPSLLCILEMERKTGILVLILEPGLQKASLYFREGRVVRAHLSGRKEPRNAAVVYSLLSCTGGTFDFHPSDVDLDDELQCSTTRLIVEGARRMNETTSPSEFVLNEPMPVHGVESLDLEKRAPLDSPPPSHHGPSGTSASVDRSAPEVAPAFQRTTSRTSEDNIRHWLGPDHRRATSSVLHRWASAKSAVAILLAASFALLVLSAAICSGPGRPASPSDSSMDFRESTPPAQP